MSELKITSLNFSYPDHPPLFKNFSLLIPHGSRTLLVGANGAGKSTLLKLMAGRHFVSPESVTYLGLSPFHHPSLVSEIEFVDGDFPIFLDLKVSELISHGRTFVDAKKEAELIQLLEINPDWRMHQISDGQRRRIQLLLTLRRKVRLLLLDEITTHLDVLVRSELLQWLKLYNINEGLTIVYTTHIFDGLWSSHEDPWPTHLCLLKNGFLKKMAPVGQIQELLEAKRLHLPSPLLAVCETWMRAK